MALQFHHLKELQALAITICQSRALLYLLSDQLSYLLLEDYCLFTLLAKGSVRIHTKERAIDTRYLLQYSEDIATLVLAFNGKVWLINSLQRLVVRTFETKGKHPYLLSSLLISEGNLYFGAMGQRNLYCTQLFPKKEQEYKKIKIPQKVQINCIVRFKDKLLLPCSDAFLRIIKLQPLSELNQIGLRVFSLLVSPPQTLVLISNELGQISLFTPKNLLEAKPPQAAIRASGGSQRIVNLCWLKGCTQTDQKFVVMFADYCLKLYGVVENEGRAGLKIALLTTLVQGSPQQKSMPVLSGFKNKLIYSKPSSKELKLKIAQYLQVHGCPKSVVCFPRREIALEQVTVKLSKNLLFQKDVLFVQNKKLFLYSNLTLQHQLIHTFKELGMWNAVALDIRPINKPALLKQLLLTVAFKNNYRIIRAELSSNSITSSELVQGSAAIFLGKEDEVNPPILVLAHNKSSIRTIQSSASAKQIKIQLQTKVSRVFWTPLREGFALLFKLLNENKLKLSRNEDSDCSPQDLSLGPKEFRLEFDDIFVDARWNKSLLILAVLTHKKIYFLNKELKLLKSVLFTMPADSLFFGSSLLVKNSLGIYEVRLDGSLTQLISLDVTEQSSIIAVLADRLILSVNSPQLQIRHLRFSPGEVVLSGYMGSLQTLKLKVQRQTIKEILLTYGNQFTSQRLIQQLQSFGLHDVIQGLDIQNYRRPVHDRILQLKEPPLLIRILRHELDFEADYSSMAKLVLGAGGLLQPLEHAFWVMFKARFNRWALKIAIATKDEIKVCLIQQQLSLGLQIQGLVSFKRFGVVSAMLQKQIQPSAQNSAIWQALWKAAQKVPQKQLKPSELNFRNVQFGFGTKPFVMVCQDLEGTKTVLKPIDYLLAQTVQQFMGLNSRFQAAILQDGPRQAVLEEEEDDQFSKLVVYWRFDEGKGEKLKDLSNFNNDGTLAGRNIQQCWERLQEGFPLQLQDKWGKRCQSQFSVKLSTNNHVVSLLSLQISHALTLEVWVKPYSDSGILLMLGENLIVGINKGKLVVIQRGIQFDFQSKLQQDEWNFVSVGMGPKCFVGVGIREPQPFKIENVQELLRGQVRIGSQTFEGQVTEFRLWKRLKEWEQIKEDHRLPLSIVAEKKKQIKVKIKQKAEQSREGFGQFFSQSKEKNPFGDFFSESNGFDWDK